MSTTTLKGVVAAALLFVAFITPVQVRVFWGAGVRFETVSCVLGAKLALFSYSRDGHQHDNRRANTADAIDHGEGMCMACAV